MEYELLYIVPGHYTEAELSSIIKQVETAIQKNGGTISQTENLGKKKLAYPIKRIHQGYYILHNLILEPAALDNLNVALKLIDEVTRHQITKKTTLAAPTKAPTKKNVPPIKTESKLTSPAEPSIQKSASSVETSTKSDKTDKKVSLDELDQKIDEILKKDIDY